MAANDYADIQVSDSDDEDFYGFNMDDIHDVDLIDENVELDDQDELEIENEIYREERDPTFEAYEFGWLRQFDMNTVGPQNIPEDREPYDIYSMYFDNDILSVLVTETNLYYEQYIQSVGGVDNLPTHSRARKWRPVSVAEMKVFIALLLFMGLGKMQNYKMYNQ